MDDTAGVNRKIPVTLKSAAWLAQSCSVETLRAKLSCSICCDFEKSRTILRLRSLHRNGRLPGKRHIAAIASIHSPCFKPLGDPSSIQEPVAISSLVQPMNPGTLCCSCATSLCRHSEPSQPTKTTWPGAGHRTAALRDSRLLPLLDIR